MNNKTWRVIQENAGFFVTMAVCLLVVAISGYFLLFDKAEPEAVLPAEIPVTTPAAETPEPSPVVETISPAPVVETVPPPMPETEIGQTVPVIAEAPRLIVSPLNGEVLAAFAMDELVYNETLEDWRTHDGVDISAKPGTTVLAACSGTVLSVVDDVFMGTTVVIEHDGNYQTTYANLQSTPNVKAGDQVSAGQIIGAVGTSAAIEAAQSPHLHFGVTKNGEAIDPETFLNRS